MRRRIEANKQRLLTSYNFHDSFFSSLLPMACAGIATDLHKTKKYYSHRGHREHRGLKFFLPVNPGNSVVKNLYKGDKTCRKQQLMSHI
jgi:hypothetical protein